LFIENKKAFFIDQQNIYKLHIPFKIPHLEIITKEQNELTTHKLFVFNIYLLLSIIALWLFIIWKNRNNYKTVLLSIFTVLFCIFLMVYFPEFAFYLTNHRWYKEVSRLETFQPTNPDYHFTQSKNHEDQDLRDAKPSYFAHHYITQFSNGSTWHIEHEPNKIQQDIAIYNEHEITGVISIKPVFEKSVFYFVAKLTTKSGQPVLKVVHADKEYQSPTIRQNPNIEYLCVVIPDIFVKQQNFTVNISNDTETSKITEFVVLEKKYFPPPTEKSALKMFREPINYQKGKRLRILTLGGSTTHSDGEAPRWNTFSSWSALLEARLEVAYPGKFEVVNLGIGGGETGLMLDFFEQIYNANFGFKDLKPDLVLFATVWNDIGISADKNMFHKELLFGISYNEILDYLRHSEFLKEKALQYYLYTSIYQIFQRIKIEESFHQSMWLPKQWLDIRNIPVEQRQDNFSKYLKSQSLALAKMEFEQRLQKLLINFSKLQSKPKFAFISFPGAWFPNDTQEQKEQIFQLIPRYQKMGGNEMEKINLINFNFQFYTMVHQHEKEVVQRIVEKNKIPFIDITKEIADWDIKKRLQLFHSEDIHMTTWGYNVVADRVFHSFFFREKVK